MSDPLRKQYERDINEIEKQWDEEVHPMLEQLGFFEFDLNADTNP